MRVLLVEDDRVIAGDIRSALTDDGFVVDVATDGEVAWFLGDTEDYAAIILDLGLPKLDGMSVLKRWRSENRTCPVLILSARDGWSEKVSGIEAGADDYLAKPFQMAELIARLRGLIRRSAGFAAPDIEIGALKIDQQRARVLLMGKPVTLSPLEFRAIDYLAHQRERIVSAAELAEHLHGSESANDTNAIEALVSRLRRKLGADIIATRRGFGYQLASEAAAS